MCQGVGSNSWQDLKIYLSDFPAHSRLRHAQNKLQPAASDAGTLPPRSPTGQGSFTAGIHHIEDPAHVATLIERRKAARGLKRKDRLAQLSPRCGSTSWRSPPSHLVRQHRPTTGASQVATGDVMAAC